MTRLLAATALAFIVAGSADARDRHHRHVSFDPMAAPAWEGKRVIHQRRKKTRKRVTHGSDSRAQIVTAHRKISSLERNIVSIKRELDQFKAILGSPAIVAAQTPSLAALALMPLPDVRERVVSFPEPVGPQTASLPSVTETIATFDERHHVPLIPSERSRFVLGACRGVNESLLNILHEASRFMPEGYTAKCESGVRKRGRGYHPRGLAADVRIYDQNGKPPGGRNGWYQHAPTFRLYEQFAQDAKRAQVKLFPGGRPFVWGGYFKNRGPFSYGFADSMHMQLGGPMGGGNWYRGATGVNRTWLAAKGGESVGMAEVRIEVASSTKRKAVKTARARAKPAIRYADVP